MTRVHGRFEVPGRSAVVVVDASADGETILAADVIVRGEEVEAPLLGAAAAALVGASRADGVARLGERLARSWGLEAAEPWLAEAIAIAARRAMAEATDWSDLEFDVVHDAPLAPALHMALDQVLAEAVGAGTRRPTLRFWEWDAPAVVIGSFQSVRNEVDPDGAARHGVSVVRRVSGGGAMFIQPAGAITFSLAVPAALVEGMSFATSYAFLDDWAVSALRGLGVDARYVPLNDIASPRGKIAGAAQKRLASGAVLHHVTMAYEMDSDVMLEVLRTFRPPIAARGTRSAQKRVDPIRSQIDAPRAVVVQALEAAFRERYRCVDGALTPAERARAEELAATTFATPEWTARVP